MVNRFILKCIIVTFIFGLITTSCSSLKIKGTFFNNDASKIKVLSTTRMIKDLVDEIGGEFVDSISLINGELDPHSYELVKGDDEKFCLADIIFCNGLGLEHSQSLRRNIEGNKKSVFLGNEILKKHPDLIIKVGNQLDPHIWLDMFLWSHCIEFIKDKLIEVDGEHKVYYQEKAEILFQKMLSLDNWAKNVMKQIPSHKRYLVSGHNAFNYFVKRYFAIEGEEQNSWQNRSYAPEGLSPEAQISSRDILSVIDFINQFDVKVIFLESNLNGNVLRKVKKACKADVRLSKDTLCGDSLGKTSSYFEMFQHNINTIRKELLENG